MKACRAAKPVLGVNEAVYTLAQVASRLSVHPETLKRAIRAGRLRALVFAGSGGTRIGDSALQEYLRALETNGHPLARLRDRL
jgi:excisionase family DNA binding protein